MTGKLPFLNPPEPSIANTIASKPSHPVAVWAFRAIALGVGACLSAGFGILLALLRPDLIWQPLERSSVVSGQRFTLSADAVFEAGKSTIRSEGFKLLDQVAAQLPLTAGKTVRIVGHTDLSEPNIQTTNQASNTLELSFRRAIAVRDYLVRLRGDKTYHWIAIGYGASRPIAPNDSAANRKTNRRIEVVVDNP